MIEKLYNWGKDASYKMGFTIFRGGANTIGFHYCISGDRIMFSTRIYKGCPLPLDMTVGDTAHAWELQSRGYRVMHTPDT